MIKGIIAVALVVSLGFSKGEESIKVTEVISIYDISNIKVKISDSSIGEKEIILSPNGLITPKYKARCLKEKLAAQKARDFLIELFYKPETIIELKEIKKIQNNKYKANIFLNGTNINSMLIENKYAYKVDKTTTKNFWCKSSSEYIDKERIRRDLRMKELEEIRKKQLERIKTTSLNTKESKNVIIEKNKQNKIVDKRLYNFDKANCFNELDKCQWSDKGFEVISLDFAFIIKQALNDHLETNHLLLIYNCARQVAINKFTQQQYNSFSLSKSIEESLKITSSCYSDLNIYKL